MPSVNIYVREEDYQKWRDIEDKPRFIHNALNDGGVSGMVATLVKANYVEEAQYEEKDGVPVLKTCKHGYSPMLCKFAKNGKPCK